MNSDWVDELCKWAKWFLIGAVLLIAAHVVVIFLYLVFPFGY